MPEEPKSKADTPAVAAGDAKGPADALKAAQPSTEKKEAEENSKKTTAAETSEKKQETAKVESSSSLQDNDSHRYLNEELAKATYQEGAVAFDNGQRYQISIFFAPKFLFDGKVNYFTDENYTFLSYNKNVKTIVIEDKLAHFGTSGYIDVVNTGEHLNHILDRLNCYHLVINFRLEENEERGIRFEPYIFDITNVANIVDDSGENKQILRLNFVDMFSYIAMQHSMATLLKYDPSINKKTSYRQVFKVVMDYFKRFILVNYNNIYSIKKDVLFGDDNRGASANVSALVENSFRKMDPTCTIYEGLEILLRDAGTPIKSTDGFREKFNDFDYMLVPVFYKEEYSDLHGIYQKVFDPLVDNKKKDPSSNSSGLSSFLKGVVQKTATVAVAFSQLFGDTAGIKQIDKEMSKNGGTGVSESKLPTTTLTKDKQTIYKDFNGTSDCLLLRPCTMRDIQMPFVLCFNDKSNIIFESINPAKDADGKYTEKENSFNCMNGRSDLGIANYMYFPTNQNMVQKLWKNMVICNMGQQDGQASAVMIDFNWVYFYYIYNFLGYGTGRRDGYTSNITPSFFLAYQNNRITDSSVIQDFSEMNANFHVVRSTSDLNEALIHIGKNLTSFVTQNDTYQFRVRGNLFRHPNEIIKVSNNNALAANPAVAIHTDMANNDYILVYITSVKHTWEGAHYTNDISANKIYERLVNDTSDDQ